jgi:hypothetical protein
MPNLSTRRPFGFTPSELRKLRALKTPAGIQRFLDDLPYHLAGTAWSPRTVLREETALPGRCDLRRACSGFLFPPSSSIWKRTRTPITSSQFSNARALGRDREIELAGCRYREPVYRTLRELALSYFNTYFNLRGERTLRRYSRR